MADEAEVKEKKPLSTMKIVILAVVLASIISGGVVGLTMFLLANDSQQPAASAKAKDADTDDEEGEEDEAVEGPPIYHRLDPKFVVSSIPRGRFGEESSLDPDRSQNAIVELDRLRNIIHA